MSAERLFPLPRRLDLMSSPGCSPCPPPWSSGSRKTEWDSPAAVALRNQACTPGVRRVSRYSSMALQTRPLSGCCSSASIRRAAGSGDYQFPKRFVCLDPLRDLVHGRVREHGSRLVPAQELAAGEMVIGQDIPAGRSVADCPSTSRPRRCGRYRRSSSRLLRWRARGYPQAVSPGSAASTDRPCATPRRLRAASAWFRRATSQGRVRSPGSC